MKLPHNHTTSAALYEDASVGLYRGKRKQDGASAIIKTIRTGLPAPLFRILIPIRTLLVLLLIIGVTTLSASSINSINKQQTFNSITIEDGLSINTIRTIRQDAFGYIWIGTSNGLNKYDGHSVSSYFYIEGDSTSLVRNLVFSLFQDSKGRFWIGTDGGLCYYNYNKNNFIRKAYVVDKKIINCSTNSIYEDKNGIMWIGTSIGLFSMNVETLEAEHFPIFDYEKQGYLFINTILIESDSILNIGTRDNGYFRYNILTNTYKQYINVPGDRTSISENAIETIYQDLKGTIWIGTRYNGVNIFNPETNSFTRILLDETNEESKKIRSIVQDSQGRFWFGTRNGLYTKNDMDNEKFVLYANSDHLISKLNHNSIRDIYIDNSGVMWVGTNGGGVNYVNPNRKKINHFKYVKDNNLFLNNKIVHCFAEDKKGNLWIGTGGVDGGLNVLNQKTGKYFYYTASDQENSLSGNNIRCMAFDDNNGLWIGTNSGGLDYLDVDNNKFHHFTYQENNENSISANKIYSMLYDSNKNIWLGTPNGLCLINGRNKKIDRLTVNGDFLKDSKYESFDNYPVNVLYEDKDGNIYLGMYSIGIFQFQKANSSFKRMDIQEYFVPLAIYRDTKKNLWMGTNAGLFLIDNFENSDYKKYSIHNGLPSNYICGILEDEKQNLWISTSAGLVKFNNAVNNPHSTDFVIYDQSDGIQSKQFLQGAAYKSEDGQLFFGGINGFNAFYPDSLEDNDFIPPVYINEFHIFNKPVPISGSDSPLQNTIEQTSEIKLSWKQSVFSFGFIALNYIHPEKNLYAYKMEGFDKDWNYTDASQRLATYTNLDPGKYTFRVKVSNKDGVWNEEGAALKLTITPPWWETWWFRSGAIVAFLTLVFAIFQLKEKRIQRQHRELEHQVAERTVQLDNANKELESFAYSVSHDLHAPVRRIDGWSLALEEDYSHLLDEQAAAYLKHIRSETNKMDELIENLLNLSRISRDEIKYGDVDLSSIAKTVTALMRDIYKGRKIEFIVEPGLTAIGDKGLLETAMTNLFDNACKYTKVKKQAKIEFGKIKVKNKSVFFIRDNGTGFDMKYAKNIFGAFQRMHKSSEFPGTGIGLATVQRIIHRHGGHIWAEAKPDEGATFYFTISKEV